MEDANCPDEVVLGKSYDPLDPLTEVSVATSLTCTTTCLGPPPEGPEGSVVSFAGDMSDLTSTYSIGTLATYTCATEMTTKYALCDSNGEWVYHDLSTCELSGADPVGEPVDPLPKPEDCTLVPADLGANIVVQDGECYFIKSHKKYSVAAYPPKRQNLEWIFESNCQILRVQFESAFFGIDGDPYANCQDGDALNIWDEKKKPTSIQTFCGAEKPKPLRLKNKNRAKIFQWKTVAGLGDQDGFQAYITVKGC